MTSNESVSAKVNKYYRADLVSGQICFHYIIIHMTTEH